MNKSLLAGLAAGALTLVLSTAPAMAGTIATPHVAGDFQGWSESANPMTETGLGTGIWSITFPGLVANSRHEFKITDGTWTTSVPGANSWFFADGAGSITITYDGNTYADGWSSATDRIGLSTDPGIWTAAGDWQSQVGGGNWDNANPNTAMSPLGGGLYEFNTTLVPGNYFWKSVVSGSWDSISWDSRSVGTADWAFSTDAVNNMVSFRVDALTGVAQVQVVPEPSTIALFGLAGILFAGRSLRRRVQG